MIGSDIAKASALLAEGKLVAIPTETVYGLAANALNTEAVAEIYAAKNRPSFNPLILHVGSLEQAQRYVSTFPEKAQMLADKFWPGSLSILLPKSDLVPDLITAGSSNVVLRVPNHPLTLELLNTLDFPLAAPSANISNTVSPTQAQHVIDSLGTSVSYILNGGDCSVGLESTIVAFEGENIVILREGGISQEEIQKETNFNVIANKNKSHESPGQLKKHYATSKPLYVVESINDFLYSNPNIKCSALVFFEQKLKCTKHLLSKDYNLSEIANSLFSIMRKADQDQTDCILVEMIKQEGIGRAIADRLNRASSIF